jgi:hypothetical protein
MFSIQNSNNIVKSYDLNSCACLFFLTNIFAYKFIVYIFPIETERKDTSDTARVTSYLDIHLDIDSEGRETERKDTTYTARFTSYLDIHLGQCRDVCQGMK